MCTGNGSLGNSQATGAGGGSDSSVNMSRLAATHTWDCLGNEDSHATGRKPVKNQLLYQSWECCGSSLPSEAEATRSPSDLTFWTCG